MFLAVLLAALPVASTEWVQAGADIDGVPEGWCGYSVALSADGSRVAVGEPGGGVSGTAGRVHVYSWNAGNREWIQTGDDIVDSTTGEVSGWAVAFSADGSRLAVGAPYSDSDGTDSGRVRVFSDQSSSWVQLGQDVDGEAAGDQSGRAVALSADGAWLAVGAHLNQDGATPPGKRVSSGP